MEDKLLEYIKLAEEVEDSACHVINAMAEKYPLGADFDRYNDDIRKMVEFCSDERTVAMAKALIEAEEALKKIRDGMPNSDDDYYDGWAHEYRLIADKALSQIQALNGGEDDKQR